MTANPETSRLVKRQQAAQLLEAVLDERVSPSWAINRWPEAGEEPDFSLDSAFQALWHFESDEAQQQSEVFYLDAQLELLAQMARFLKEGKDLPAYMLAHYPSSQRKVRFFYDRVPWEESWLLLCQPWIRFRLYWQQVCRLLPFGKPGQW